MTWRDALYSRTISETEKAVLVVLGVAGVLLERIVYFRLLWETSTMRNTDVGLSDHLRLYAWMAVFSWVYARILLSFKSRWRFVAILPFLYYFLPMVLIGLEALTKNLKEANKAAMATPNSGLVGFPFS